MACSPASVVPPVHGLAMLQAASIALADQSYPSSTQSSAVSDQRQCHVSTSNSTSCEETTSECNKHASYGSLSALLNPASLGIEASLPTGFVLGKDGKIKKKRGRKPTPGMSDEDRRKARLLKNRRTAEISRRRKLAQLNKLTEERDSAQKLANQLSISNDYLIKKLANTLGISIQNLLKNDSNIAIAHQDSKKYQHDYQLYLQQEQEQEQEQEHDKDEQSKSPNTPPHSDISQHPSDDEHLTVSSIEQNYSSSNVIS